MILANGGMAFVSASEAQDAAARWQKLLLLQDWEVVVQIKRGSEFTSGQRLAEVSYNVAKKQAIVVLLDPDDFPQSPFAPDHEKSLVHELLHLHFAYTDPLIDANKSADTAQEVAIDSLARAFVRLAYNSEQYFTQSQRISAFT